MDKNARLADIYIKIYNKHPLMMEDLAFLAKYDRECFEKTCRNLIYNIPEARELMKPVQEEHDKNSFQEEGSAGALQAYGETRQESASAQEAIPEEGASGAERTEEEPIQIGALLDNLKKMEWQEMPVPNLDAGKVKSLLGSLYMEMLFPHNDRYRYFNLEEGARSPLFNRKV